MVSVRLPDTKRKIEKKKKGIDHVNEGWGNPSSKNGGGKSRRHCWECAGYILLNKIVVAECGVDEAP